MTRILVVAAAVLAVSVLLWSSWRLDRRLFALVCAVTVITLVGGFIVFHDGGEDTTALPPDQISLSLDSRHATESGVRLTGTLENRGERPVAQVLIRVRALACADDGDDCSEYASAPLELRMQVPSGKRYPFSSMVRLPPDSADETYRWVLEVESVRGYDH